MEERGGWIFVAHYGRSAIRNGYYPSFEVSVIDFPRPACTSVP